MSYTFIVLDLKNKLDVNILQSDFNKHYSDYEVLYCSTKLVVPIENFVCYSFEENSCPEEVINRVLMYSDKQNIVVIREYTNIEDIKKQTNNLLLSNQVVYFKQEKSAIKKFFGKIIHFFAKMLFFKDLIVTNASCVSYGEVASNILKKIESPSNLMRTNQWQGVQLVGVDGGKKYKFKYNFKKYLFKALITFIILLVGMVGFFVFKSKFDILLNVVIWLVNLVCLFLGIVFGTDWYIKSQIGENVYKKAKIKGE